MVAVLLLVLWAPVTAHCTLEAMPQLSFLSSCCGEKAGADCDHCAGDACQSVESGHYRLEDNPDLTPEWVPQAWLLTSLLVQTLPDASTFVTPAPATTAPLEVTSSWQFAQRAAPSPRAPSFVS